MLDPIREDITDETEYPSAVLCEHLGKCRGRLREARTAIFGVAQSGERDADQLGQEIADYLRFVDIWERIAAELARRGHDAPDRRPGLAATGARTTIDKALVKFFSVDGGSGDHEGDETEVAVIAALASLDGTAQSRVQLLTGLSAERIEELGGID